VCTFWAPRWASAQATVNESLESAYLYVDATSGSDSNPGTQSKPFKTIGKAASEADTNNHSNIGTLVTINPGTYRETLNFNHEKSDTSMPVTFQAATTGTVIISGSEVYTGWSQYSGNSSIYDTTWSHHWGECANASGCPSAADIVLRREMVAVNGSVMTQVMSLAQMVKGTFFVDESGGLIYVWPPSGTNMGSATVEVATQPTLVNIWEKSNLVFRGLTFQYANSCRANAAVEVTGSSSNILFDSDTFQWNNGQGIAIQNPTTYFTVENTQFLHNGDAGIQASQTKYGLYQSDTVSYSNWRGAQGAYYACNTGGLHYFNAHTDTLTDVTTSFNEGYGLHWDTDHKNITTTGLNAAANLLSGLFSENNQGPITIDQAYVCNQTSPLSLGGLDLRNSKEVSLTNSVLMNNYATQILFGGDAGGKTITDWESGNSINVINKDFTNTGNTIQGSDSTQNVFQDGSLGGSDWTTFQTTLTSNSNTWWNTADLTTAWVVPTPNDGTSADLATWQSDTGQDTSSTFKAPSGNPGSACNLTPTKDFWLTVDNGALTTDPAGNAVFNFTVTPLNFSGTVNMTLDGITEVSGLSDTLSSTSINTSGTTTLTVSAKSSTKAGSYPVTLIARNGSMTRTSTVDVTVPTTSLRFSSVSLEFGSQQVNTTSASQTFTIQNTGSSSVSINSFKVSKDSYSQTNNCGSSLKAGATCTVTVTFTPVSVGDISATITVNDGDKTSPQTVNLDGTGTAAPTVTISPSSLHFGTVKKGTKSSSQTTTLTNTGTVNLSITSVKFTGTNPGDFSQTNNCGSTVAAGASCTFTVTFTPAATGSRSASGTIYDNTHDGSSNFNVTGTGD
jgi:hypothetical protein